MARARDIRLSSHPGQYTVMLEAKGKDVALLTLRQQLSARGIRSCRGHVMV